MEFKHISVLLDETIEELHIKPDGIYVDGTLGGGGHAYHVCQKLSEKGRLSPIPNRPGRSSRPYAGSRSSRRR